MNKSNKKNTKKSVGLIVAVAILGSTTLGLGTWAVCQTVQTNSLKTNLNTIYQKSYYDFYDTLSNVETKMNKVVSTSDQKIAKKYLDEISKNANQAQDSLNALPLSVNGLEKSLTFLNQISGYTQTLTQKLDKGSNLDSTDRATLLKLNASITDMRKSLNKMTKDISSGYDILTNSLSLDGDYNNFTISMQQINAQNVEYPTMIYDGPFADSQIKKQPKGLNFAAVDQQTAKDSLARLFNVAPEKIVYKSENQGNFECYNYEWQDQSNNTFYAQMTKKGGKLLSMTSRRDKAGKNLDSDEAITVAKQFLIQNGINDAECVWSDIIEDNIYLNFAPIESGIILYPDLIKLKIDLSDGAILGYEATSYYTNHTDRNLGNFAIDKKTANSKIQSEYKIDTTKKVLAPIDYSEILCYEVKCTYAQSTYYFYIDAQTGQTVNILKVIQTTDGSKLM